MESNIIYCDKCKFEWPAKDTVFETLMLNESDGTKMRYFVCPECGEEYIVDITNRELRKLISMYKKMQKKYIRMYNAHESETRLRNYGERLENVQNEIKTLEADLKRRWTRNG